MGTHVAIDVGTSGGTLVVGAREGDTLRIEEVARFDPGRTESGGVNVWDLDALLDDIVEGLETASAEHGPLDTVGIDATAGGFGFVADGEPLRDPVREGSAIPDGIDPREAFFETGHGRLPGRYYHTYRESPAIVERADWLLTLPSLLAFELGADQHGELTYAISAGLGNTRTRTWSTGVLEDFGLPTDVLPPMADIGATVGRVDAPVASAVEGDPDIVAVPGHDTSAAVAAIPFDRGRAFLATGSWFIPGFEVAEPVVTDEAYAIPAENVGGVAGTARFVRNVPGFSILEHCREAWRAAGGRYEYDALLDAAAAAEPFGPLVDTSHDLLRRAHRGDDPLDRIAEYCRETGQPVPEGEGEITRCLLESLAASSAVLLDRLGAVAGEGVDELRVVGGGVRNDLLRGMLVDATGVPVVAGPTEATAIGNLLVQLRSASAIGSIAEGRDLVRRRVEFERHEPDAPGAWDDARERMRALVWG